MREINAVVEPSPRSAALRGLRQDQRQSSKLDSTMHRALREADAVVESSLLDCCSRVATRSKEVERARLYDASRVAGSRRCCSPRSAAVRAMREINAVVKPSPRSAALRGLQQDQRKSSELDSTMHRALREADAVVESSLLDCCLRNARNQRCRRAEPALGCSSRVATRSKAVEQARLYDASRVAGSRRCRRVELARLLFAQCGNSTLS